MVYKVINRLDYLHKYIILLVLTYGAETSLAAAPVFRDGNIVGGAATILPLPTPNNK